MFGDRRGETVGELCMCRMEIKKANDGAVKIFDIGDLLLFASDGG